MSPANQFTFLTFVLVLFLGGAIIAWQTYREQRPSARIRQRMEQMRQESAMLRSEALEYLERARRQARQRRRRARIGPTLGYYLSRIQAIGGRTAWVQLGVAAAVGLLVASAIVLYFDWYDLVELTVLTIVPVLFVVATFASLVRNFRKKFLAQLPEALDMVRRASRAGVPPVQALRTVGNDMPAPLGREFRIIGDALFLGDDIDDVLDAAVNRIRIPEFAFFAVFLKTQRATGGPLSETLENISEILRERNILDLKVRALTSEGRTMAKVMAALPFAIFAMLFLVNREYVMILLNTETGQRLLILCAVMITAGLLIINRLARLED